MLHSAATLLAMTTATAKDAKDHTIYHATWHCYVARPTASQGQRHATCNGMTSEQ